MCERHTRTGCAISGWRRERNAAAAVSAHPLRRAHAASGVRLGLPRSLTHAKPPEHQCFHRLGRSRDLVLDHQSGAVRGHPGTP